MTNATETPQPRAIRSYVLRQGRITAGQERAFADHWPRYGLEVDDALRLDAPALFNDARDLILEIGFGNGDSLVQMAAAAPQAGYIGIEVHRPGVGHAILAAAAAGIDNLRLIRHDAVAILRDKLGVPAADGDNNYFDGDLSEAVIAYQQSHGLKADGIVSGKTRNLLNGTPKNSGGNANADRLMINMERLRWMPQDIGDSYVLVNIPSYYVKMYRGDKEIYASKAVVGQRERQTPAFTDKLRHIVMSPTWTVPPTIMKKDKINKLRSNPGAFDGNFEAVVGGRVVRPSAVDWSAPGATGYRLRQKPGARNALGRVKFLFPNKHAIYLHDTPSKSLFNRPNRALSSGCVRLQKPEEFANVLLKNTNWSSERIKKAMNQEKEQWVNTPEQTPIYLVYWTTWSDPDGNIQNADDIYGKDSALLQQYKKALN